MPRWLAVKRAGAAAAGKQRSRAAHVWVSATLIPNVFRNVAERRRLVRPVCWRPVRAIRAVLVELGATHGDVERRGRKAVDGEPLAGGRGLTVAVASGGAVVAARNDRSDALRGRLLPKIVVE